MTRPVLQLVGAPRPAADRLAFCGYCGHTPAPEAHERVCASCEMGVVLSADERLAPGPGAPFLVVDSSLCVCAVSAGAEWLLGTAEPDAVNRHLGELLLPAAAEARGANNLLELVIAAAGGGDGDPRTAVVRPAGEFGVRYLVRIGACGPPAAALVVLADDAV